MIPKLIACFLAANLITFFAFAWDKRCARTGKWRISERRLLFMALVGGSAGAVTGQLCLRHKTRKEPFRTLLLSILTMQLILVATMSYAPARHVVVTYASQIGSDILTDLRHVR
jgi:uncharacterized membrane protein YsdA (DUF1294 family)